jgi:hypothetical protein
MPDQPEFDFEHSLPPGREFFTLRYLAKLWSCSEDSVQRLIDTGDLPVAVDLAPSSSVKAMQRVTRASVVALLNRRKSGVFDRPRSKARHFAVIDVTAEDIRKSRRPSYDEVTCSTQCPIALAAKRAVPHMCVSVSGARLRIHEGRTCASYVIHSVELPFAAVAFLRKFDDEGKQAVSPFTFSIDV